MGRLPERQSLVSQTAAILREELDAGTWKEWLPGERVLCETLQVSRNTLRAALTQLKRDGVIKAIHGAGNQINVRGGPKRKLHAADVALLSLLPLEQLRPTMTLWIDALRGMLSERDCRLHIFHGQQYFRTNSGPALHKLVAQHPHACWILALSNENTQHWFERNRVPCVVAGSVYAGLNLPFRDLDHRAICRHAAGVMLGLGHRKIGMVIEKSRRAGDIESEAGFVEGVRQSPHQEAEVAVTNHDGTVTSIANALRRVMEQQPPPTALLVANAYHFLTVLTRLLQMGYRVPQDISVMSRDEDRFLAFVLPSAARYVASPQALAKTLMRPVLELLQGGVVTHRTIRLMPAFVKGDTLAAVPRGK